MESPHQLGDYTIIKPIGQGALGLVYLAEHRLMKKQFALKVLPEDLSADRNFIQRFEEEVGQLTMLEHPHIVKVHNVSFDKGRYFLVTDCIVDEMGETTNFLQYLHSHRNELSEEEMFRLFSQIAEALDYAHLQANGIAHRGIKLNNILVSKGGEKGVRLYLSDFGLSRVIGTGTFLTRTFLMVAESLGIADSIIKGVVEDTESLSSLHTSFLQNFHFLAPEQKKISSPSSITTKVDIFAFGVLVYYTLMGQFPDGYFDLPSQKLPELRYRWDSLISICLRSDPEQRPVKLMSVLEGVKLPEGQSIHPTAQAFVQQIPDTEKHLQPVIQTAKLDRPEHDPDPAAALQVDSTVKQYVPEMKDQKHLQPLQTEMVVVEGGTFYRGSSDGNRDEIPRHQVTIDSFAIDVHPVTNEQFVRFLEAMGGVKDGNHHDIIRLKDSRINSSKGKFSIESGYLKHPVVGVTWYGAVAYAKWVGKRLPTETEWEIAACGGEEETLYPSGEDVEKSQANFFNSDTTPVMSYPPNGYRIFDMAGNVYEWCQDWYGYNSYETSALEPVNPRGPLQGEYRVLRGGCWKSLKEDLRCSRRHRNNPGTVNSTYGFRCAADVK